MAKQTIGIGSSPNDGTGDTLRDAFDKCNDNFTELYGQVRSSHITYDIGSGGDYATLHDAIAALEPVVAPTVVVTLNVLPGVHTYTDYLGLAGPFTRNIRISGSIVDISVSSVQSSSGSAGDWSIVLNVSSVTNVEAGNYIGIHSAVGGTLPSYLDGAHEILSVDAVNTRITIKSTHRAASAPSGAVAASGRVFRSVIKFNGCDGICPWDGASGINVDGIAIVGNKTTGKNGLSVQDVGRCFVTDNGLLISSFYYNIFGNYNSEINEGPIWCSNAVSHGVLVYAGATILSTRLISTGNGGSGVYNHTGGSVYTGTGGVFSGNTSHGVDTVVGGSTYARYSTATGNGGWGFRTDANSSQQYTAETTASGNTLGDYLSPIKIASNNQDIGIGTQNPIQRLHIEGGNFRIPKTTYAAPYGRIYKDTSLWLHDFSYGDNGSVTPAGYNQFWGEAAGNSTLGAAAGTTQESSYNIGVGQLSLFRLTTGYYNTCVGAQSGSYITTGVGNSAFGGYALGENPATVSYNVAVGTSSLRFVTTGDENAVVGRDAGRRLESTANCTSISTSVLIGAGTKPAADGNANCIIVGYGAIGDGSNTAVIGNASVTTCKLPSTTKTHAVLTVATLPSAATVGVGARSFVSDADTPVFGSAVAGGGAVAVPVYSNGSTWLVG